MCVCVAEIGYKRVIKAVQPLTELPYEKWPKCFMCPPAERHSFLGTSWQKTSVRDTGHVLDILRAWSGIFQKRALRVMAHIS